MMLLAASSWLALLPLAALAALDHSQHGSLFNLRSLHSHPGHRRHSRAGGHGLNTETTRRAPLSRRLDSTKNFTLVDRHEGESFFKEWTFFSAGDPTHGMVQYVDAPTAFSERLAYVQDGVAVMTVDTKTQLPVGQTRKSVRIESKKSYDGGLFIIDVQAMPYGPAVWPAFWMLGPDWPSGGEVDIIEGVHDQDFNLYTLHTSPGCKLDASKAVCSVAPSDLSTSNLSNIFSGTVLSTICDATVNGNSGCGIADTDAGSYGAGLNDQGGGVFATLWDADGIRIYFFPRCEVPLDILAETPHPSTWGSPKAFWASSSCSSSAYFHSLAMVFDITLCGDWAGATYSLAGYSGTCAERVANPANFETANWKVRSIKVYN